MSMAPTTEQTSRSDLGQRFFLLSVFAILAVEVVVTVFNVGMWFEWSSCLLGILAAVGILWLGNWLWSGDKTALTVTRVWVVVMFVLALVAQIWLLTLEPTLSRYLGVNAAWQGWLKLAAYGGFACALFVPGVVLDFVSGQRGEAAPAESAAATAAAPPTGEPVELTAEATKALTGLSGAMKVAAGLLPVLGILEMFIASLKYGKAPLGSALADTLEGFALVFLGALLALPSKSLQNLLDTTPRNTGHVMGFLLQLLGAFKGYALILPALAIAALARLALSGM
jgi:hypothetical protein